MGELPRPVLSWAKTILLAVTKTQWLHAIALVAEASPDAFEFGLWFGPASPVDTTGSPDQVVPYYAGQGDYQAFHAQTAPEVVAVMAFTTTTRGAVAELDLPWNAAAPTSPPDQFAVP